MAEPGSMPPLPELPREIPELEGPGDDLAWAGPATRTPWVLSTPETRIVGDGLAGLEAARGPGPAPFLEELRAGAGTGSNVHLSPRCVRRELVGAGGVVLETVRAADRQPGLVAQWSTPAAGPLELDLALRIPGRRVSERRESGILLVETARPGDAAPPLRVTVGVHPEPSVLESEGGDAASATRVVARVRAASGPVTLLAAPVEAGESPASAFRALRHLRAVEGRSRAEVGELRTRRLATRTGVGEVDDGLAWAAAALVAPPGAVTPGLPIPHVLALAVAALAAGDRDAARGLLDRLPNGPAAALGVGWWMRWTADPAPLAPRLAELHEAVAGRSAAEDPEDRRLLGPARRALADALEAMGHRDGAAGLRSLPPPRAAVRRGQPLPMVGPPGPGPGALLASLLDDAGEGEPPAAPPGPSGVEEAGSLPAALRAWALYAAGRPDDAFPLLRAHLAAAVPPWPSLDPPGSGLSPGVLAPAALLHGLLGGRAEAPWGRLRLAPALPAHWSAFGVDGIAVGDARVGLVYAREGGRHTFTLRPTAGRVPVNLVFEPRVPGRVEEVRVDDEPAEVDLAPRDDGRTRIRLQLPLDADRKVSVAGSPG